MPSGILPSIGLAAAQDAATDIQRQKLQSEIEAGGETAKCLRRV